MKTPVRTTKKKITKERKVTFTYREYGKGSRSLHYDRKNAKEIVGAKGIA